MIFWSMTGLGHILKINFGPDVDRRRVLVSFGLPVHEVNIAF